MAIYDNYSSRDRLSTGVKLKRFQNRKILELGLKNSVANPRKIFEIGPGDGYLGMLALERELAYTGIEASEVIAGKLRELGLSIVHKSVPPLPADLEESDCCYMLHVIEHMRGVTEASQLVDGIGKSLKPGGTLVIACPDYVRWRHHFYEADYTHTMPFTRRGLAQLLRDHGFEIAVSTIYTGPVFGYWGLPVSWLAKLMYPQILDDLVGRITARDIMYRGFLTLLPSLLIVARKK